ncbi:MAG: tRNA lysidine(34) synthetase TilS [Bacilli bacterium]|nr:tRNA lysidine(34) synthetase TilS [Bacilli bacterium]
MIKINLDKKLTYLLGCSYGPDSMALFDLLLKGGYKFAVAHVNYALRDESSQETKDLIAFCKENNIEIFVKFVEEKIEKNIEEKCREIRYNFFKELQSNYFYDSVLIAHNLDDKIETYLMQKNRRNIVETFGLKNKTEIFGCSVERPLLDFTKDELKKYDDDNNVPYAIDSSNENDAFERNKVRHMVISRMSKEEKNAMNKEIFELNSEISGKRAKIIEKSSTKISELLTYSDEEFAYYLIWKGRKVIPGLEISLKRVKELIKVMESDKSNVSVKIKDNLFFIKSYDQADLIEIKDNKDFSYIIQEPCAFKCEYFELDFTGDTSNRNVTVFDYPLTIRNAKSSDVYLVKGSKITMRRQFINWKMPAQLRKRWPIILNKNNEIIYVPRYDCNFDKDENVNFKAVI